MTAPPLEVVGAVIERDGLILCALRSPNHSLPSLWEFPGGKVELGETHEGALTREIVEELGCKITVLAHLTTTTHAYDTGTVRLHTYRCVIEMGVPTAHEHEEVRWVAVRDLKTLNWAPADVPSVDLIRRIGARPRFSRPSPS